jgi:hypothetical protein
MTPPIPNKLVTTIVRETNEASLVRTETDFAEAHARVLKAERALGPNSHTTQLKELAGSALGTMMRIRSMS